MWWAVKTPPTPPKAPCFTLSRIHVNDLLEEAVTLNEVIFIFCAVILIWWPIGGFINSRRGQARMNWLQAGIRELGATGSTRWLRSFHSVGQLTVRDLREPFRSLDVLITLESRDNLILWLFRHLARGRRDEMIIQAEMIADPVQELEVGFRGRNSYDMYLYRQKENPFTQIEEKDGFRIARRGGEDNWAIERLRGFLKGPGKVIQRMSLQRRSLRDQRALNSRDDKNLLLRADMTRMDKGSPAVFFAALREWASNVAVDTIPADEPPPVS
jgi:hypothetical protein